MALIKCPECGKEISDKSSACIHCGYPLETNNNAETQIDLEKTQVISEITSQQSIDEEVEVEPSKEDNNSRKIIIILAILAIIVLCIMIGTKINKKNANQSNERNAGVFQIMIATEYINIRKSSNTNSKKLGQVKEGEIYTVLSEREENDIKWYEIETSNGIRGYVAGRDGYVRELYVNTSVNNNTPLTPSEEETTTTTMTAKQTTNKPQNNTQTPQTTKKVVNNSTTTTKKQTNTQAPNTTTKATTTTTTQPPKVYTITSIEGVGSIFSRLKLVCRLDSFNAKAEPGWSDGKAKITYDYTMTVLAKEGSWSRCAYEIKIYNTNGTVIHTSPFGVRNLSPGEQGVDSGSFTFDTNETTFRIKLVPNN